MSDLIDVIYRLRDMACDAADPLRAAIADAQAVLDRLDKFATHAEDGAQLIAASDPHPTYSANIPDGARLVKAPPRPVTMDELGPYAEECDKDGNLTHPGEMPGEAE